MSCDLSPLERLAAYGYRRSFFSVGRVSPDTWWLLALGVIAVAAIWWHDLSECCK